MQMSRARGLTFSVAVLAVAGVLPLAGAPAALAKGSLVRGDFDGDGRPDMVVSAPQVTINGHDDAGEIVVTYSSAGGGADTIAQGVGGAPGTAEAEEFFGMHFDNPLATHPALAFGDFNGDGYGDLAAASSRDTESGVASGAVYIFPGSASGLRQAKGKVIVQGANGVPGTPADGNFFGSSLVSRDFDGDGRGDLAIGGSGDSVSGHARAGDVTVLFGSKSGLNGAGARAPRLLSEHTSGVPGNAAVGDAFGYFLAAGDVNGDGHPDLVLSAPGKAVANPGDQGGAVFVFKGSGSGIHGSGATKATYIAVGTTPRIGTSLAVGDFNHDGFADVAAGAPFRSSPSVASAGAVVVFTGGKTGISSNRHKTLRENTSGVPGAEQAQDRFGFSLSAADITGDGRADLVASAPGEAVAVAPDVGQWYLFTGSKNGLRANASRVFSEDSPGMPGTATAQDICGWSTSVQNVIGDKHRDLVIGCIRKVVLDEMGESVESGVVLVIPGTSSGLSKTGGRMLDQEAAGGGPDRENAVFGAAILQP